MSVKNAEQFEKGEMLAADQSARTLQAGPSHSLNRPVPQSINAPAISSMKSHQDTRKQSSNNSIARTNQEIIHTAVPRITISSVSDLACIKKFVTLRVQKQWPPREPVDAIAHGTAVHEILRDLYSYNRHGDSLDLAHIDAITRRAVYKGRYSEACDRDIAIARAKIAAMAFVESDDGDDIEGTKRCEELIEFEVGENGQALYLVSATLDRVIVRQSEPDLLVVRDYKTGKAGVDLRQALIQLWAAKQRYKGFARYKLEVDSLNDDDRIEREVIWGKDLIGQKAVLHQLAKRVLSASMYIAEPGPQCTYCPLRPTCDVAESVEFDIDEDLR